MWQAELNEVCMQVGGLQLNYESQKAQLSVRAMELQKMINGAKI